MSSSSLNGAALAGAAGGRAVTDVVTLGAAAVGATGTARSAEADDGAKGTDDDPLLGELGTAGPSELPCESKIPSLK